MMKNTFTKVTLNNIFIKQHCFIKSIVFCADVCDGQRSSLRVQLESVSESLISTTVKRLIVYLCDGNSTDRSSHGYELENPIAQQYE